MGRDINIEPIAFINSTRTSPEDDFWGGELANITLVDTLEPDALAGLETFSHVDILYVFHKVTPDKIVTGARHPRNDMEWPKVGIFAQRGKNRPNRIGSTICRVIKVEGRKLTVAELDAIEGTPVIDIKPVMKEFLPRQATRQPAWATELMTQYWLQKPEPESGT